MVKVAQREESVALEQGRCFPVLSLPPRVAFSRVSAKLMGKIPEGPADSLAGRMVRFGVDQNGNPTITLPNADGRETCGGQRRPAASPKKHKTPSPNVAIMFVLMLVLSGCTGEDSTLHTVSSRNLDQVSVEIRVLSDLGLEPLDRSPNTRASSDPLSLGMLRERCRGAGLTVSLYSDVQLLLDAARSIRSPRGVVCLSNKTSLSILGLQVIKQQLYLQVVDGFSRTRLLSRKGLMGLQPVGGLLYSAENVPACSIALGAATIRVDSLLKNLGLVDNASSLSVQFHIGNRGSTRVRLSKARSSCSCTVPDWPGDVVLEPGDDRLLPVSLRPSEQSPFRHEVWITATDLQTGEYGLLRLTMFGAREEQLTVKPSTIDFGRSFAAETISRTVNLRGSGETGFVPAQVLLPEEGFPLRRSVWRRSNGEATEYSVELMLESSEFSIGRHEGRIQVIGDDVTTKIEIPVSFEKLALLRFTPSTISFGQIPPGKTPEQTVRIERRDGGKLERLIQQSPADCSAQLLYDEKGATLRVCPMVSTPGFWRRTIHLDFQYEACAEKYEIPCVGLNAGDLSKDRS